MKPRSTLKAYFKKGAIPKESEFADLIDSMLVQDEDSIIKPPNDPLSIKATGAEEALLNFYRVEEGEDGGQAQTRSTWQLKQKPGERSGLSIHYDGSDSRLFIASDTGNVGIGTTEPRSMLSVAGRIAVGTAPVPDYHLSIDTDGPGGILIGHTDEGRTSLHIGINERENGQSILQSTSATGSGYGTLSLNPGGGNVGIGTTEPGSTLSVAGGIAVGQRFASDEAYPAPENGMTIQGDVGIGTRVPRAKLGVSGNLIVGEWAHDSRVSTPDNGMIVSGSVGIGTTDPQSKLHVQGDARISGDVRINGWLDMGPGGDSGRIWVRYLNNAPSLILSDQDDPPRIQFQQVGNGSEDNPQHISWIGHSSRNAHSITIEIDGGECVVNGVLRASAVLSATNKLFRINHPARAGYDLVHSCIEGPENGVYYRGTARLHDGRATVQLPPYFEALTRPEERTVQLTPLGPEPFLLSYTPVVDGQFTVYGNHPEGEFAWHVSAVRADVPPLDVEVEKDNKEEDE